ncbi:MAG: rhomboid family intramembrane serine protease [Actinomycetota bacterium]
MREGAFGEAGYRVRTRAESMPAVRAVARADITRLLIAINVIVFIITGARSGSLFGPSSQALARSGALVNPLPKGQIWRMFTAMFLHFDVLHIAFNMYALVILGRAVEARYGKARYLGLYLASGLLGSAASITFHPILPAGAGASGAIFGIFGSLFAFVLMNRNLPGTRALLSNLVALVVINAVFALAVPSIDKFAHLGGMIGGFLIAMVYEFSRRFKERQPAVLAATACLLVAAVSFLIVVPKTCSPNQSIVSTPVGRIPCDQLASGLF